MRAKVFRSISSRDLEKSKQYMDALSMYPRLTPKEEADYAIGARAGNIQDRNRLIEGNLRLVIKVAKGYLGRGIDFDDLIAEGNAGLIIAASKYYYQPGGAKFSTYAVWWIEHSMGRAIANHSKLVRIPPSTFETAMKMKSFIEQYRLQHGHSPSEDLVCETIGVPNKMRYIYWKAMCPQGMFDDINEVDASGNVRVRSEEYLDNGKQMLQDTVLMSSYHATVDKALDTLSKRQQDIICRRAGLRGQQKQTLQQVADQMGVCRERVRQLESEGMKILRIAIQQQEKVTTQH